MPIRSRYPETILYNAKTVWDGKTGGIAIASDGRTIVFDTPRTYGGRGEGICPDEMFVSAVLGCFQNTFLDFQIKFELELVSFELEGTATSKFDRDGYTIVGLDVKGRVVVAKGELEIAERCVALMKQYCHLTRTIKECLPIHYDIKLEESQS